MLKKACFGFINEVQLSCVFVRRNYTHSLFENAREALRAINATINFDLGPAAPRRTSLM